MPTIVYSEIRSGRRRPPQERLFSNALAIMAISALVIAYVGTGRIPLSVLLFSLLAFSGHLASLAKRVGWHVMGRKSAVRVAADDEGLAYSDGTLNWRWRWDELSQFDHSGPDWLDREFIRFRPIRPDWKARTGMGFTASGQAFSVPDAFEGTLREISATLNEYRDRALAKPASGGSQSTPTGMDQP